MAKTPKKDEVEIDPRGGDAILKRMLQTKPKQQKDMMAERKAKGGPAKKGRP